MKKLLLLLLCLPLLFSSCNKNSCVLEARLQFDGNCCTGNLYLYSNYTFKVTYTTFADDHFGNTEKGEYIFVDIDANPNTIFDKHLSLYFDNPHTSHSVLIKTASDLFSDIYKIECCDYEGQSFGRSNSPLFFSTKGGNILIIDQIDYNFFPNLKNYPGSHGP